MKSMKRWSLGVLTLIQGSFLWADEAGKIAPLAPMTLPISEAPVAAAVLFAGKESVASLSRDAAIELALAANPAINQAREALENKTGVMWQVRSSLLPKVSAFAQRTSRDHSTIDRGARDVASPADRSPIATQGYSYGIEIRQLLFDGFSSFNRYRQYDYQKDASYWQLISAGYSTISQLQQAYDNVLLREGQLATYTETVKAFQQLADVVEKRERAGERTPLDSLRVQTELKRVEADRARVSSDLAAGAETLRKILQLACGEGALDPLSLEGPLEKRSFDMPIAEALARAAKIHPEIFAAEINRDSAQAGLRSAQGTYLPTVEAFARYSVNSSYAAFNQDLEGWTLGLSGNWLIFDSLGREGSVRAQHANLMTAEIQLSDQRYQLTSRVRQLYAQMEAYGQALEARSQAVVVGERAVNESRKRYELGETDIEMVIDAERAFQGTLLEFQQGTFEYNATIYQLEYVVGLQPVTPLQITPEKAPSV